MRKALLLWALLNLQVKQGEAELTVAKLFSSGMVLQEAPATATIFGSYTEAPVTVTLAFEGQQPISLDANLDEESLRWDVVLPQVSSRSSCNISINSGKDEVLLEDVLFGDVWFCAGQSNMGWSLGGTENHTEELEMAKAYNNIRMYRIDDQPNSQPQYDIQEIRNGWLSWNTPSSEWPEGTEWEGGHWPRPLGDFSGICFLFARELSDHLGNKPLGLITGSYAGTRIEAWSPPETLSACGIEDYVDEKHPWHSNSYLYNGMVAPMQGVTIKGAIWYQGESSSSWNPSSYLCTFPTMIDAWRQTWAERSGTEPDFPVGVVQVGPWKNPPSVRDEGSLFPLIRWHQTLDFGYLPNPEQENMFLAMALDTYRIKDGAGQEHPNNKQLPAKRLGWAALRVVYEMEQFPAQGPFPIEWQVTDDDLTVMVSIDYTEQFEYKPVENSGFFHCCSTFGSGLNTSCDGSDEVPSTSWSLLPMSSVEQTAEAQIQLSLPKCDGSASLAYLWAESPVTRVHGLPIYRAGPYDLPAMPWWTWVHQT